MAPSSRQLFSGQVVLRIPGSKLSVKPTLEKRQRSELKLATINISTVNGKEEELIEVMKERELTILQ